MFASFVERDTGSFIRITATKNSDNTAFDLTNYTTSLTYRLNRKAPVTRSMSAVNAAAGIMQYQFTSDDLTEPGDLLMDFKITDASNYEISSINQYNFKVRKRVVS